MQATKLADQLVSRPQIEMIGVSENDFGAQLFERLLSQSLDARSGSNRQKKGRLYHAVWRGQPPAPRPAWISLSYFKGKAHFLSVSGENPGNGHSSQGKK